MLLLYFLHARSPACVLPLLSFPPHPHAVVDVLAWRSSASVPVFCGVNVLLLAAASASATSILVFVAKFTVAAVAAGFVKRHALGASPQLGPVSADEIARFAKRSEALINSVLQLANSVLTAHDLRLSIITVATLYAFTLLASVMSVGTMVYGAFGLAFGVVPLHRVAHVQIEQVRVRNARAPRACASRVRPPTRLTSAPS